MTKMTFHVQTRPAGAVESIRRAMCFPNIAVVDILDSQSRGNEVECFGIARWLEIERDN